MINILTDPRANSRATSVLFQILIMSDREEEEEPGLFKAHASKREGPEARAAVVKHRKECKQREADSAHAFAALLSGLSDESGGDEVPMPTAADAATSCRYHQPPCRTPGSRNGRPKVQRDKEVSRHREKEKQRQEEQERRNTESVHVVVNRPLQK